MADWTSEEIIFWLKEDLGLSAINDELWRQNVPNVEKLVNLTKEDLETKLNISKPP